ncbi:MAG: hypothetical protein COB45_13840 [Gammaproteobacteria bacterium]|jgi:hypothetical protein|nr:MAG: hypothetical protein COB45_13840 [Gammaproteobacteria bacterium]PHR80111.1 MAG: hypothetical protein COA59_17855 [Colwellia sp.]
MIKFTVKILVFFISLSFVSIANATLITNLTQVELDTHDYTNAEDKLVDSLLGVNYINYKGYDWAWVSPVNVEYYTNTFTNTLYAPELQKNWQFADSALLNILKTELTLADFTNGNDIIQAAQFFNSDFDYVDSTEFDTASSEWIAQNDPLVLFLNTAETFYVRPSKVPEPTTLMIFSLGLIALVSRKKLSS